MPEKTIYCDSCDAEFKINHNMDDDYYQVKYCPFCGEELDEDNVDEDTE